MAQQTQFSAIDIKQLWYIPAASVTVEPVDNAKIQALIAQEGCVEVKNIHQDTWAIEEAESSQDSYKNQLSGSVYRMGKKVMGDVTFAFTIGQYDFKTKADLLGGTATDHSWKRQRGIPNNIYMCMIALTTDDIYCVLPKANVNVREANTDGAIGLAVVATALEPSNSGNTNREAWSPEIWVEHEYIG